METFETATSRIVEHFLSDVNTAMPAKIVRVNDADTLSVDVQPLVNLRYGDGTTKERAVIQGIPVLMPATGTAMVSLPIAVGDFVLLVFAERNIDNFKAGDGNTQAPADLRTFAKQDAVAIPGIFPFSLHPNLKRTLPTAQGDLSLTANIGTPQEVTVRLLESGEVKIISPISVSVEAPSVTVDASTTLDFTAPLINMTGAVFINGVAYTLHTHSGVTPGVGVSGPVTV